MSWHKYDLTFRLLAPLHIGWRQTGNLMQTRSYVTGKVFWAALTARLTRNAEQGANGAAYHRIGEVVQTYFRFTYLYPALQEGDSYKICYPWQPDFDYHFLDSYTSAALDYDSQSAEDGLLHETEFIAPRTRCDQPVYLTGDLHVYSDLPDDLRPWQDALPQLQFGAERSYGWGRVDLVKCEQKELITSNEVSVTPQLGDCITAHLKVEQVTSVVGAVEPLIGWERNNAETKRAGWKLSDNAQICYVPGSKVTTAATFQIGANGLWVAP